MTKSITITEDDEMYNDVVALLFGSRADVEANSPKLVKASPPEEEEPEEEEEESSDGVSWDSINVGDTVLVDFGEDGQVEAEVSSKPKKNKEQIQVTPQDTGEPEMVDLDMILEVYESEETEEEEFEFASGDEVAFKVGRKKMQGIIKTIMDDGTAKIKIPKQRKLEIVEMDKLSHIDE